MSSKHLLCNWVAIFNFIISVAPHPTSVLAFAPPLPLFTKHPLSSSTSGEQNSAFQLWAVSPQAATTVDESSSDDAQEDLGDDLSKQELNVRFWEVRDYYRENPDEMTQADVCLKLLSTRLANIRLHRCQVAPSTIGGAGNGLFATRDIANEELITMYPGDAVLIASPSAATPPPSDNKTPTSPVVGVMFGSHIHGDDRIPNRVTTPEARSYEMEINKYTSIVADPQIGVKDPAYLGHFANDGVALDDFDAASRATYTKASVERQNAAHFVMEGAHMVTVATKPIAKGDEIFVTYGEGYWLSRSLATTSDTMDEAEKNAIVVEIAAAKSSSRFYNLSGPSTDSNTERPGARIAKVPKKVKKDTPSKGKSKGFGK